MLLNNNNTYILMSNKEILRYFPPVNNLIQNPYQEAEYSYKFFNSLSPLKNPEPNQYYSIQILNDLQTLRQILNSAINEERFLFEIEKLINAWGPYSNGRDILNRKFLNIANVFIEKENKKKELIEEAQNITTDYRLNQLEKELSSISFIHKPRYTLKDLNISKLKLNNNINNYKKSSISKAINKKRK